jgi:protein-S-isoprenylcysteine O-methyltransferase Ste14
MIPPLLIFLSMLLFGIVHSILASLKAKALARRWWGERADRLYRLAFNMLAPVTLLPALALFVFLPRRILYVIPLPWMYLSGALQVLAVVALAIGLLQTGLMSFSGLAQLANPRVEEAQHLVTGGLYQYVRHPLYTAGLVFIWLTPMMTDTLLALNLGATVYLVGGAMLEEHKLLQLFGQAYADYRARTPMLIPGLRFRK